MTCKSHVAMSCALQLAFSTSMLSMSCLRSNEQINKGFVTASVAALKRYLRLTVCGCICHPEPRL